MSLIKNLSLKYLAAKDESKDTRKIFVLGSGRSGTHLLGYVLDSHHLINATIEKPKIFTMATTIALNKEKKERLLPNLVRKYKIEHAKVAPKHYVDKSHSNIWISEELSSIFPNAKFIGIQREPYSVVASMLKHEGVLRWQKNWSDFPIPNEFLGITTENVSEYESMAPEERAALRWCSHAKKMDELKLSLGNRLMVINYESLVKNPEPCLVNIAKFLELHSPFPPYKMKIESLEKWKHQLSDTQIENIDNVVEKYYYSN
ncbi:sulfotransferase [Gracilibacillus salitolerans]|uniref:Sulfotransferase n=1 Tax=Gracilibacillus salitolerans TaxID=2663022 RepID=A0A5Q2TMS1_9BACI|nr:sulfotransferase [Gracilibacillus salitolerans]QGH36254.1 sulfotransferase [Gracilibacillus salitolerans]